MALLDEHGVDYRYREYRDEPLSEDEVRGVLRMLDAGAADVLRTRDRAYKELQLSGAEDEATLIGHLAAHPTLLQRPIGVLDGRAVIGRPPERLLELARGDR